MSNGTSLIYDIAKRPLSPNLCNYRKLKLSLAEIQNIINERSYHIKRCWVCKDKLKDSQRKKVSHNLKKKKIWNHSMVNQLPKLSITLLSFISTWFGSSQKILLNLLDQIDSNHVVFFFIKINRRDIFMYKKQLVHVLW